MQRNLAINNLSAGNGRVFPKNAGLYDHDGESTIYVPATSEASSLQPIDEHFYMKKDGEGQIAQSCKIRTMDTFVREQGITCVDFIKCDTEGAEKMVFDGAAHVLKAMQPMVYTEMLRKHAKRFGYHPNEIIEYFQSFGYDCYREENRRLLLFESMDKGTVETNFFFLHREKHADVIEKNSL